MDFSKSMISKDSIPLLQNSFRKKEPWRFRMSEEVSETVEFDALEGTRLSTDLICLDNLY